ncbi:MAG: PDZ domain-containing protein [Desulfurobacteriaceae bacterium]
MLKATVLIGILTFSYSLASFVSSYFLFNLTPCVHFKVSSQASSKSRSEPINLETNLPFGSPNVEFEKSEKQKEETEKRREFKEFQTLDNFVLRGVIVLGKNSGFVVLEKKGKKEVKILRKGEKLDDLTLLKVFPDSAIFTDGNRKFTLKLFEEKKTKNVDNKLAEYSPEKKRTSFRSKVFRVKRQEVLKEFSSGKFLKDIGITPSQNPKGIRVLFVRRGSFIDKLGIRRGDVIISVNDLEIRTLEDSFSAFERLKTEDSITITLLRHGKKIKLQYEIE